MIARYTSKITRIGLLAVCALAGLILSAPGGNMDAPAAPTNALSAMWTLENIYNVLDTRTTNVIKRAGAAAFAEPAGLPTNGTMHTLNDIMTLVTNRAPVKKSGQTVSYAANDDGALQMGVAWPTNRFTIGTNTTDQPNDTNCVVDNLTGLMWARNANIFGVTNYFPAVTNCLDLVYGGYDDWRLPNFQELLSLTVWYQTPLLPSGHPFNNVGSGNGFYWTSSALYSATAFSLDLSNGNRADHNYISTTKDYVWPVRGGGN